MPRRGALGTVETVRDIRAMPDGTPVPPALRHTLIVLASFAPKVWPSQESLALALGVDRRTVNRRLKVLVDAGLISRTRRGWKSTQYGLRLNLIRKCDIGVLLNVTPDGHMKYYVEEETDSTRESGSDSDYEFPW
jgi:DNA-binding transcriptional MocR family regulator